MGTSSSSENFANLPPSSNPPPTYLTQYTELHKEEHPLLGAITHVQSNPSKNIC